jgi:hypothetical protein
VFGDQARRGLAAQDREFGMHRTCTRPVGTHGIGSYSIGMDDGHPFLPRSRRDFFASGRCKRSGFWFISTAQIL